MVASMMKATLGVVCVLAACGPGKKTLGGDDDPMGDAPQLDAPGTPPIDGDFTPVVDASCGTQTANIGVVNLGDPPDLLVVLDRSGSMSSPPATFPPTFTSKWSIMQTSLTTVVQAKQTQIKFCLLYTSPSPRD